MGVVSVRVDDADLAFLRQHDQNISKIAREAIHGAVQRMKIEQNLAYLASIAVTPDETSQDQIRRERDSR